MIPKFNEYSNADLLKHPLVKKAIKICLIKTKNTIKMNGWTQGAIARSYSGQSVHYNSQEAETYSIEGALRLADDHWRLTLLCNRTLKESIYKLYKKRYISIKEWNDDSDTNLETVLRVLDDAIQGLKV